jgi:DNA-binding NarL/FixJ family response regulator/signal transduction histidine kinase
VTASGTSAITGNGQRRDPRRDISSRESAQEEMSRRAEQQALVAELGRRALASDDLRALLDEAAALVARTLDVQLAAVTEIAPGAEEVICRAGIGWREGVVGRRIERVEADALEAGAIARDHGAVSGLSVTIATRDEPFGVLSGLSTRRRTFSESDVSFMQAVANVLAGAVERSRVHERLIEVRELERRRIARDLHDEALQDLNHALELAARAPALGDDPDRPDELTAALRRVGEQLRGAIHDLRLGGEERTPFPELLEALVAVHRAMAVGCEIELEMRDGVPAGPLGAMEQVRVLLVEDHTAVREAIASAFARDAGFDVVGQAASLAEARELLEDVDVAVLDLGLPDGFGADLIEELNEVNPGAQALVLTASLDRAEVARAIQRGAAGVLDKMAHLDEVVDAVRRLRAGEILLPLDEVVELLRFAGHKQEQERRDREAIARLTRREREVLHALGDGLDSQQIAARLHISVRTERNHVASILTKLGVHSQLQAVLFALRYEVIRLH